MYRNKTARQHSFAIVPRAEIPRSKFSMRQTRKQAFNASDLIPIMVEEVLPGDVWSHKENVMARLATPIAPAVDDIDLETFYFFVPNRIIWEDWEDFISGVDDEIVVPKIVPEDTGGGSRPIATNSVFDHMGILPQTYTTAQQFTVFPIWAYFTIWNEWFRDQNLQAEYTWPSNWTVSSNDDITNGTAWDQMPLRVNKRHDYFTSSLPWPQKGASVMLPLGTTAPIGLAAAPILTGAQNPLLWATAAAGGPAGPSTLGVNSSGETVVGGSEPGTPSEAYPTNLYADLATATAATINQIRLAFQTQKMLERDARGGSRYVEQLLAHFGVRAPDFRLQRPEYLGGSKIPITVNPVAQTAAYDAEPGLDASPVGNLGAEMHASGSKRSFTYSATEHGYIIGLATVRATPTYQQGTRRHWRRSTRLDYYFPVFSHLGEQAVDTQEIYQPANNAPANGTWGYQERHAEYRYTPNEITGVLRSTYSAPLDWWHYAEEFGTEPALNAAFITDKTQETLARSLAVDTSESTQWSAQIIMDILHESNVARLMPAYAVPGLIDHF